MISTTMNDALDELKEKQFERVAQVIVKYQDYKRKIAVSKMDNALGKSTKMKYLAYGVRYLKTGYKCPTVPKSLYLALDKCIETHIQPLRPSADETKRVYKRDYTKKDNVPPVSKLKIVQQPITEKFIYGIKMDDKIVLQKSELEAQAFIKGVKFLNDNANIQLVAVTISEVD